MNLNINELRRKTNESKPHAEEERRRLDTERKAREEAHKQSQRTAEEQRFQDIISSIQFKAEWSAREGKNYAIIEKFGRGQLNISHFMYKLRGMPKRLSRDNLSPIYQRVYDYCQEAGFIIEMERDESGWEYPMIIKW